MGRKKGVGEFEMWYRIKRGFEFLIGVLLIGTVAAIPVAAAQTVEKYSFVSYTVLNPAIATANINTSPGNTDASFLLLTMKWGIYFGDGGISSVPNPDSDSSQAFIIGPALFYPNPFKQSVGAHLGYRLSRNADVDIRIFDMRANQIFKTRYNAGVAGGIAGYNRLVMNRQTFNGFELSSGVYFFILSSDDRVIAKGKFVVVP